MILFIENPAAQRRNIFIYIEAVWKELVQVNVLSQLSTQNLPVIIVKDVGIAWL